METRVTFEKVVGEGRAMGYLNGKAVFCVGPLPGETAMVRVTRDKSRWAEAELIQVIDASSRRHPEHEPHYLSCSPWQAVDYAYQLELKAGMLAEAFRRPGLELETGQVVSSPTPLGYRNKLEFALATRPDGTVGLAFHHRGAYDAFSLAPEGCVLGDARLNHVAVSLIDLINKVDNSHQYDSMIVRSDRAGGCIAMLVVKRATGNISHRPARRMIENLDMVAAGLTGCAVVRRHGHDRYEVIASAGRLELAETFGATKVSYPWDGFFQVNPVAFEAALAHVTAAVLPGQPAVDLYGGAGTIGLAAARVASRVTGVEINPAAVELAARNADRAGLRQYESVGVAAERLDPKVLQGAATIIVDPPRAGLHPKALAAIRAARPARIIYLSCNPVTQARDLVGLVDRYRPGIASGFDFYPGALHLESLIILDRRDAI